MKAKKQVRRKNPLLSLCCDAVNCWTRGETDTLFEIMGLLAHELSEHEEVYDCKVCHQLSAGSECFFCAYRKGRPKRIWGRKRIGVTKGGRQVVEVVKSSSGFQVCVVTGYSCSILSPLFTSAAKATAYAKKIIEES